MADAPLRALRQASAAVAFQHSRLRSLNLSFLLLGKAGQDPAWGVHSLPLGAWARAVWGGLLPLDDLFLAFEWARRRFVGAQRPWLRVVGPAGAVVASLHRLGWQPLSAVEWVDDLGRHIHLRSSCPKSVVKWVHSAVDRWSWRQIAEGHPDLAHLRDGACLERIRGLIRKAGTSLSWGFKEGASLEAIVTGAAPCQSRLFDIGAAEDDRCQSCKLASGSYRRRHWHCDVLHSAREQYGHWPPLLRLVSLAQAPMHIALLERALLPDPRSWAPAPKDVLEWIWHVQSQDGFLEGPVFIDASASGPSDRLLSRVGIGVATVSEDGSLTAALHAAMPFPVQEPGVGDIFVAASVLQFCIPPVELVTDYAGLVEGFELGPSVTTSASRKYADVWALFWKRAADFGPEAISIRKVPAHVSRTRMLDGEVDISFRDWVGNQQADLAAKRGVAGHPSVAAVKAQLKRVTTVVTAAA